jgi:glycosyltransferase involved in cell wall biosynthesis
MAQDTVSVASRIQGEVAREQVSEEAVNLIYIGDFPPSNLAGGPILTSRLLRDYPPDRIVVLTSSRYLRVSPKEGRLACVHVAFPTTTGWGRWGLGRMKNAIDWLMLPVLTLVTTKVIRNRDIAVILTVAHGKFFLAAALAGWITRTPYIVMMHDDTFHAERPSWVLKHVFRPSVCRALRGAAHVYAISPEMQRLLKFEYGVDSELQKPATERNGRNEPSATSVTQDFSCPVILYAGAITGSVEDSLRLLAQLIVSGKLKDYGIESAKFHIYTTLGDEQKRAWNWNHKDLVIHPWVAQNELPDVLTKADVLFLPFSFSPAARHSVETSFPSKTADYLASGTPIVVFGPSYSSLVAYARREGFAEIVSEGHADALASAIRRIVIDPAHRQALSSRALQVFSQYHDISKQRNDFLRVLNSIVTERSVASRRI